ncbi:MAG: carboxyl transferase domain-containing protein [Acidimicrobiia bacterium]
MPVIASKIDASGDTYLANRAGLVQLLAAHEEQLELARGGGGARYVERHRARGKLTARERIELLLDQGSPFLELSPLAAWGSPFHVGASIVTGVGVVSGLECVIIAHDPTVRGGSMNPYTLKKNLRALEIARVNRLPLVNLVESGGADLPTQADLFVPAGQIFRDLTLLSGLGIPTIALVFGNSTAGGAYVPGMCDYSVLVDQRAKVFLGGPPLVKMATGEESDDEELGGAAMHARISGLADYFARDELDCIRIGREIVADLNWRKLGPAPTRAADEPIHDPDELLGIASVDLRVPFDPREVLARVVDGSRFDEYKAGYGTSLVAGWASIHGYPVGVLANAQGVLFMAESKKATEFIMLANQIDTPLVFLQNTTGYMVGREYEQAGMIKDGAKMINAVTNSTVPHLTVMMGASYGAGNYGMCGRAYGPRFLFAWPSAKMAVMGPQQLAGVLSIVARESAEAGARDFDEDADRAQRQSIEEQIERESHAFFTSGKIYDDGVIDPRDTRTALGIALSAVHSNVVEGRRGWGVFRM